MQQSFMLERTFALASTPPPPSSSNTSRGGQVPTDEVLRPDIENPAGSLSLLLRQYPISTPSQQITVLFACSEVRGVEVQPP